MRNLISVVKLSFIVSLLIFGGSGLTAGDTPKIRPLIKSTMTGIDKHTMLMTEVEIPPNTTMPLHTHPVEEFLYIISGRSRLVIEGEEDRWLSAGDAVVIPAGVVHTAVTMDESTKAITTRVHPDGLPVRTLAPKKD